jgi:hypothetical protein
VHRRRFGTHSDERINRPPLQPLWYGIAPTFRAGGHRRATDGDPLARPDCPNAATSGSRRAHSHRTPPTRTDLLLRPIGTPKVSNVATCAATGTDSPRTTPSQIAACVLHMPHDGICGMVEGIPAGVVRLLSATTSIAATSSVTRREYPEMNSGKSRSACAALGRWQHRCGSLFPDNNRRLSRNSPRTRVCPVARPTCAAEQTVNVKSPIVSTSLFADWAACRLRIQKPW